MHDEYTHATHVFSADITVYHAIYDDERSEAPAHRVEGEPAALTILAPLLAKYLHVDIE
ncbi:hypothetical protein [Paraburkholderia sp. D1E]|uniref:hypothetical protein n=1 Tax=Paraburkholderia sp. D1E TaxID=3461398 RepID=UPI0040464721